MLIKNLTNTKIIATIGPASSSKNVMKKLVLGGVNIFRLNSSHGSEEDHLASIQNIRELSKELNFPLTIILDLQGPKIRLGIMPNQILTKGEIVKFVVGKEMNDPQIIPVDYEYFESALAVGEHIYINDGKVQLTIVGKENGIISAEVINEGEISSRKGINLPGAVIGAPALTERDKRFIEFGVKNEVDFFALSFVRERADVEKAKEYIGQFNSDIPVISKIEKPQAVDNIDQIILVSDGIMVARGDLGIEISIDKLPLIQKEIVQKCNKAKIPVIIATQMLESMTIEPIPTRAEVNDVANSVLDGADAVMLSGETAVGKYPVKAVKMMNQIALNMEKSKTYNQMMTIHSKSSVDNSDINENDIAITRMFNTMNLKTIIALTLTGSTASILSKAKVKAPIVAICSNQKKYFRLNLMWGVFPFILNEYINFDEDSIRRITDILVADNILQKNDKILFISGLPYFSLNKTTYIRSYQV